MRIVEKNNAQLYQHNGLTPTSGVVLKIPRVKFLKIGPLFVGMMRLVTGIGEGKER